MTDPSVQAGQFGHITTDTQAREDYILGKPPRLSPLPPEERTENQQKVLDEISYVVVDGVRKPRDDAEALEILIRHEELYLAHIGVAKKFLSEGEMSIRDRELAVLRIGWLSQAPFEWASHVMIAKRNGFTTEEIEQMIVGSSSPIWNDHERALIRAMEELHFDSMISESNGFMMYSSAPDRIASAIWERSFSVVQNTTFGESPPGSRRSALRKSMPFITGMFQSSRTASGIAERHASSAC